MYFFCHTGVNASCWVLILEEYLFHPFFPDNKYPTEEMKSELADELELTEKQISGWFCHRRLKLKACAKLVELIVIYVWYILGIVEYFV